MPSFEKKNSEPIFKGKWKTLRALKKNCQEKSVFTGHLLNMGINNLFLFGDMWDKRKESSKLTKKKCYNHLCLLICYALTPFGIFHVIYYYILS